MKKLITLTLFCLILQVALSQEIKISHIDIANFQDPNNFELKDQLPNGSYLVYYDSLKTKLDYSGQIFNQKRDNKWTWYYETGIKKREITYQDGKYQGQVISFYSNGQQSAAIAFTLGVQNGFTTRWYMNGTKKFEGNYLDGAPTGVWKYWKEDGTILKEEQH